MVPVTTLQDARFAHQDKGPLILGTVCTFTGLSTLFVAARLSARTHKLGRLLVDDFVIVLSLALGYVFLALVVESVRNGGGKHAALLPIEQVEKATMFFVLGFCPGILSFTIPKFAVVSLLITLLDPIRWHRRFLWALVSINFLLISGCIVLTYAQCNPPKAVWTFRIRNAKCWDPSTTVPYAMSSAAFSAFVDLYLAIYPSVVLFNFQMRLRKKIALSFALGFGICGTAVAIYKCTTIPGFGRNHDFTYEVVDLVIWTNIESNCVLIAACIPTLVPFIKMVFGSSIFGGGFRPSHFFEHYIRGHNVINSDFKLTDSAQRDKAEASLACGRAQAHDIT